MKVIFRKIYNEHKRLRDETIEGECGEKGWPKVGNRFIMTGPPRDSGTLRYITTSQITKVLFTNRQETFIIFETVSGSVYSVSTLHLHLSSLI